MKFEYFSLEGTSTLLVHILNSCFQRTIPRAINYICLHLYLAQTYVERGGLLYLVELDLTTQRYNVLKSWAIFLFAKSFEENNKSPMPTILSAILLLQDLR